MQLCDYTVLYAFVILAVVLALFSILGVQFFSTLNAELFGDFDRACFTVSKMCMVFKVFIEDVL